jgi:hypothetical protein
MEDAMLPGDAEASLADATGPSDAAADVTADASADAQAPADASTDALSDAENVGGDSGLCANYVFCDGFEQGFANWSSQDLSGGTITTDSTHTYRGSSALHAHVNAIVDAGGQAAALVQRFQTWPTHLFARFFAYQPSPSPPSPANYSDLDSLSSPYQGIALSTVPPGSLSMNTFNTSQDQMWQSDSGALATGQWVCFEEEIDTGAETSKLYMNDVEVTDMSQGLLGLPQLGNLGVGLSFYLPNVQPAQDAWIDDVVVSASRIGCTCACGD